MTSEYPSFQSSAFDGVSSNDAIDDVELVGYSTELIDGDHTIHIATEKLDGRKRRILASIQIPCPLEQVWQVITDYDKLAEFIPNLTRSQQVSHPSGGIRLEQVGTQCFLNVKFCARVVLDMVEQFPNELKFSMVEGDFRLFEGVWRLEPLAGQGTQLIYDLVLLPPRAMPAALIERHICRDLTQNLQALCDRAIALAD